ncbi:MAG: helix-turn-helix domain-containing protein [Steroidobacteraceae bacterium]
MPESPGESSQPLGSFAMWLAALVPSVFSNDSALADAAGVHRSTVLRWKRGAIPDASVLLPLGEATGTDVRTLRRLAGYPPEDTS